MLAEGIATRIKWIFYKEDLMERFKLQNPFAVANFIIDMAVEKDNPVTNLKLQKIMFFLQGYCLSKYNAPLIDGSFSKWRYGAVEEDVYIEFKNNGSMPITYEYKEAYIKDYIIHVNPVRMDNNVLKSGITNEFEEIIDKLIDIESWKLAEIVFSHSSWKDFKDEICADKARDYTNEEIKSCFIDNKSELGVDRIMEIVQGLKRDFLVGNVIKICRFGYKYKYEDYVMVVHHANIKTYYLVDLKTGIIIYTTRDFDGIRDFLDTDVDNWEVVDAKLNVSK